MSSAAARLVLPVHGTFAEINPSSATCQRWRQRRHSWVRRSQGGFDRDRYQVTPINESTAKTYCVRHHYSGSYPAAARRYGMFLLTDSGPDLVGVAVFGIPTRRSVLTNVFPDFEPYTASLELSRFVLEGPTAPRHGNRPPERAPANSESWFLRQCFNQLAEVGVRGVVSFSDPVPRLIHDCLLFCGHVGTIYQSKGARLTGRSAKRSITVLPDGASLSDRSIQKVRKQEQGHEYVERRLIDEYGARAPRAGADPAEWLIDALNDIRAVRLRHNGCLRYAMLTNRTDRRRYLGSLPSLPYPKQPDPAPTATAPKTPRRRPPHDPDVVMAGDKRLATFTGHLAPNAARPNQALIARKRVTESTTNPPRSTRPSQLRTKGPK